MTQTDLENAELVERLRAPITPPEGLLTLSQFDKLVESGEISALKANEEVQAWNRPDKLPFGVSPRGAEAYAALWLRWMNFEAIDLTPLKRDGGYDVSADEYVVQVKNWNRDWVSVSTIREIYGVAQLHNRKAMVFSSGFLSEDASRFAAAADIPVFLFNAEESLLSAANAAATTLLESQLARKWAKIMNLQAISSQEAAFVELFAILDATVKLEVYFDQNFMLKLKALITEIQETNAEALEYDTQARLRALLGLDFKQLTTALLKKLVQNEQIVTSFALVAELFDENESEVKLGLSKVTRG